MNNLSAYQHAFINGFIKAANIISPELEAMRDAFKNRNALVTTTRDFAGGPTAQPSSLKDLILQAVKKEPVKTGVGLGVGAGTGALGLAHLLKGAPAAQTEPAGQTALTGIADWMSQHKLPLGVGAAGLGLGGLATHMGVQAHKHHENEHQPTPA